MTKRSKKRRPKRTSLRTARQERLLLEKEVRERYRPGAADELDVEEWLVDAAPSGRGAAPTTDAKQVTPDEIGRLVGLHSGGGLVETDDGLLRPVVLASRLARDQRSTIAIGDRVGIAATPEGPWRLVTVLPRRTSLARVDPQNPRREHLIAANVDVAVVVAALVQPPLSIALIDRYLVLVERGGPSALVWLNKTDLADEQQLEHARNILAPIRARGVEVLEGSARSGPGLERLKRRLSGRIAVFVGHSGVGKSSLIRALDPDLDLRIGEVDESGRGRHTTTGSSLHHLSDDIAVIDTPGIRELGLGRLELSELRSAFPEIAALDRGCRFPTCTHTHEPDCAVLSAIQEGSLAAERLRAWTRMLETD